MNNDNSFIIIEILFKEERKQKGETRTACPLWRNGKIQTGYKRSKGNIKTVTAEAKTHLGSDLIFVVLPVQITTMDLNGAKPINRMANILSHVNVTISYFYLWRVLNYLMPRHDVMTFDVMLQPWFSYRRSTARLSDYMTSKLNTDVCESCRNNCKCYRSSKNATSLWFIVTLIN